MTAAFQGMSLAPLATAMIARATADERDANALMDLSTILFLQGINDVGLATQAQALQIARVYELPSAHPQALRLLALMAPGDLMINAPLPFLFENSDISLTMLYLMPGEPLPAELPPHDVVFVAISQADTTRHLLEQLAKAIPAWNTPVINAPERILGTSRARAFDLLQGVPGICMPATVRAARQQLHSLVQGGLALADLLPGGVFPLIIRPVDSHAGHDLAKVDDAHGIARYLAATAGQDFFISRFVDYRSADGLHRKYRVVIINGQAFAGHMGVSSHWMIHYLNAGMTDSISKRAEEEVFMRSFDTDFAQCHGDALAAIARRFGLPYLVIDCAETPAGDLLVFEVDPGAIVHAMDPVDLFPYKPQQMQKVFAAFRAMLLDALAAH
jgi:NADH:ubiquinone oxidoreductase subunit